MKNKNLTVIARLHAKPGKEAALRRALLDLIAPTRREAGCLSYDLHESITEPGLFFFYESWKNEEALSLHFQTSHILELQKKSGELLAEPLELHQLSLL